MKLIRKWFIPMALVFLGIVAVGALFSEKAESNEWVEVGALTYHFERGKYNEVTPLIGYERNKWSVSYFKNSYDWDSFTVDRRFEFIQLGGYEIGLRAGIVKGYRNQIFSFSRLLADDLENQLGESTAEFLRDIAPWGLPYVTWQGPGIGLNKMRASCYSLWGAGVTCTTSFQI